MLKITISDKIENLHKFIDDRMVLLMSENKLRQLKPINRLKLLFKKEFQIQNIDNTILYLEKENDKSSLVITTVEKRKADNPIYEDFGVAIRQKTDNEIEFYIDTLGESYKKGIVSTDAKRAIFSMKYLGYALTAILLLMIIAMTGGLAFIGICILCAIAWPIQYLIFKKKFKKTQEKMNRVISIIEAEFNVSSKTDTKDWISFWGQVKSGATSIAKDATPFT